MYISRLVLGLTAGAFMQLVPAIQPASAADLGGYKDTPYVVMPWQGLYFGAHGGGAWSNVGVTDNFDYNGDPTMDGSGKSTGLIGGGQIGYNVQRGHAVFGIEAGIGYLDISASGSDKYCQDAPKCSDTNYRNISGKYDTTGGWYGDITGRLGYAADRLLIYGKGGVAFLNADLKTHYVGHSIDTTKSTFDFSHSDTLVGWTIGAGAEYAVNPAWSIKAEYQHFDFGSMSNSYQDCHKQIASCPAGNYKPGNGYSYITGKTDTAITADTVKFGVNYHVGN